MLFLVEKISFLKTFFIPYTVKNTKYLLYRHSTPFLENDYFTKQHKFRIFNNVQYADCSSEMIYRILSSLFIVI